MNYTCSTHTPSVGVQFSLSSPAWLFALLFGRLTSCLALSASHSVFWGCVWLLNYLLNFTSIFESFCPQNSWGHHFFFSLWPDPPPLVQDPRSATPLKVLPGDRPGLHSTFLNNGDGGWSASLAHCFVGVVIFCHLSPSTISSPRFQVRVFFFHSLHLSFSRISPASMVSPYLLLRCSWHLTQVTNLCYNVVSK